MDRTTSARVEALLRDKAKYTCPLTHSLFVDPVICASGNAYERAALEQWLKDHDTDPLHNVKLQHKDLVPALPIRSAVSEYRTKTATKATSLATELLGIDNDDDSGVSSTASVEIERNRNAVLLLQRAQELSPHFERLPQLATALERCGEFAHDTWLSYADELEKHSRHDDAAVLYDKMLTRSSHHTGVMDATILQKFLSLRGVDGIGCLRVWLGVAECSPAVMRAIDDTLGLTVRNECILGAMLDAIPDEVCRARFDALVQRNVICGNKGNDDDRDTVHTLRAVIADQNSKIRQLEQQLDRFRHQQQRRPAASGIQSDTIGMDTDNPNVFASLSNVPPPVENGNRTHVHTGGGNATSGISGSNVVMETTDSARTEVEMQRYADVWEAVARGNVVAVQGWIRDLCVSVNATNQRNGGATMLHWAVRHGQANVATYLLQRGADTTLKTDDGRTAVHLACHLGLHPLVNALGAGGASLHATDDSGLSPLHIAVGNGNHQVVASSIRYGADVNKQTEDENKQRPLHICALNLDVGLIKLLVALGADPTALDGAGLSPLQAVEMARQADIQGNTPHTEQVMATIACLDHFCRRHLQGTNHNSNSGEGGRGVDSVRSGGDNDSRTPRAVNRVNTLSSAEESPTTPLWPNDTHNDDDQRDGQDVEIAGATSSQLHPSTN